MMNDYSSDLLDMGTVAWSITHPAAPRVDDYIHLVRTCQGLGVSVPQWPAHVAIGAACEWGIVMPPPGDKEREWHRTLQAMIGKYDLPQPLKIVVTNEQRDLLNAALWFIQGPVMLVTHSIIQWRTPNPFLEGKACVWWDSRPVVPVRRFTIPECDESFKRVWNGVYEAEYGIGEHVGHLCCKCGNGASEWDRDAMPYCASCWQKWSGEWLTYRTQWVARTDPTTTF